MKILISKGANLNQQSINGWTAIMVAADRDHLAIFLLLEEYGADLLIEDSQGDTVFMKVVDSALEGNVRA